MTALSKIRDAGFDVELNGDSFKITPSSQLTENQRDFLKSHKAEIIFELKRLIVTCYTPNGEAIEIEAKDEAHAIWLKQINPKPTAQGR